MYLFRIQNILLYALLHCHTMFAFNLSTSRRVDLNFTQLVEFDGYESEWHRVTTADGYVLSVFRVRRRGACSGAGAGAGVGGGAEPLVFMHGLYLSADDCIAPGPGAAHCYLYADRCRDVWVPNVRGSHYSRTHTTLDPDNDAEYWNFAFDEMALYDLPAIIDYVLHQTGQRQIVFIGHSQGAAILMVLCAKRPEYNAKVKIGFGLSPITLLYHSRFFIVEVMKDLSPLLYLLDKTGRYFEVFAYGGLSQRTSRFVCALSKLSYPFCSILIFSIIGYNRFQITPDVLPVLFDHLPSGTSVKNFLRWGQVAKSGFTEYDFGEEENMRRYGVKKPPVYDLSKVTMKWILMASENDYIADIKDVVQTASRLHNTRLCVLSDNSFGHLDFIFGKGVKKYIVPVITTAIDENKFICL